MVSNVFRRRLKERREAAGLSQGEAAESAGVTQQYVSGLERGANEPPVLEHLARWARTYATSTDYLLGLTDDPRFAKRPEPPLHGIEMWELMRQMRPEMSTELVHVARTSLGLQRSTEARALQILLQLVEKMADDESRALLAGALSLADAGRGLEAMAQVEGFIARREGGVNHSKEESGNNI